MVLWPCVPAMSRIVDMTFVFLLASGMGGAWARHAGRVPSPGPRKCRPRARNDEGGRPGGPEPAAPCVAGVNRLAVGQRERKERALAVALDGVARRGARVGADDARR